MNLTITYYIKANVAWRPMILNNLEESVGDFYSSKFEFVLK